MQVTTLFFVGSFLPDPTNVPTEVVDDLAAQLGIEDPSGVKTYLSGFRTLPHPMSSGFRPRVRRLIRLPRTGRRRILP